MRVKQINIILLSCMGFLSQAGVSQAEESVNLPAIDVIEDAPQIIPLDLKGSGGSRLGLTLSEIPASIDILTKETMQERGYSTTLQAMDSVVGVQSGQCFGLVCFSTRGFSGTTSLPFMFNGNRYPGLAMSPRSTFNYDRIEVIKGPSSVLHGLGAMTGAVNFVTKKADGIEEKEILLGFDTWNTKRVGLGQGGMLSDKTAYRIDANFVSSDHGSYGFVDNTSYDDYHLSGEIATEVTDDLRVSLTLDSFKDAGEGYFGTPVVNGKIDKSVIKNNYNVSDDSISKEVVWLGLGIDWKINDSLKLHNMTYMNQEDRLWHNAETYTYNNSTGNVDRRSFLHIIHDQELLGNRTELISEGKIADMRNRLLVGFDYQHNRHQRDNNSPYAGSDVVDFQNPVSGVFNSPSPFSPQRRTEINSYGIYAENLTDVTEALKVSLSFRHDVIELDSFDLRNDTQFSKEYSTNSWRVGTLYDIKPDLTLYAQLGQAFEPPSQVVTLASSRKDFDLTEGRQAEIGLKGVFAGGKVQATVSLFDISRTNILTKDPDDPTITQQIGEQSSQGIEISTSIKVSANLLLDANVSMLNAKYENFYDNSGGTPVSRNGNLPTDVPEKLASLWVTWKPDNAWRLGAGLNYVDERAANRANTVFMDAYTIVNAVISKKLSVGEVSLNLRNLTDEVYANHSYGSGQFMLGEPRAAEVTWRAKF